MEFPWVFAFGLGNSNGCNKGKVTNLKIPGVFFKIVCPQHPQFEFFLERLILYKVSEYPQNFTES